MSEQMTIDNIVKQIMQEVNDLLPSAITYRHRPSDLLEVRAAELEQILRAALVPRISVGSNAGPATLMSEMVEVSLDSIQAVAGYQTIECGAVSPVPGDARPALRPTTYAGCERLLSWVFAYRCVDCGLFFHLACILKHFRSSTEAPS